MNNAHIVHQVVQRAGGYCEASQFPQRRLLVVTARVPGPDGQPLCSTLILRTSATGTLSGAGPRAACLWYKDYPALTPVGGLSEDHAHIVTRVEAGELP